MVGASPSVLILSAVRTRAKRVALKVTVPSLFRGMFMPTSRCGGGGGRPAAGLGPGQVGRLPPWSALREGWGMTAGAQADQNAPHEGLGRWVGGHCRDIRSSEGHLGTLGMTATEGAMRSDLTGFPTPGHLPVPGRHPFPAVRVTLQATRCGQNFPKPSGGWILLSRVTTSRCLILPLQGHAHTCLPGSPPSSENWPGRGDRSLGTVPHFQPC